MIPKKLVEVETYYEDPQGFTTVDGYFLGEDGEIEEEGKVIAVVCNCGCGHSYIIDSYYKDDPLVLEAIEEVIERHHMENNDE